MRHKIQKQIQDMLPSWWRGVIGDWLSIGLVATLARTYDAWLANVNYGSLLTCKGKSLDKWGEKHGCLRLPGEEDDAYRKRIQNWLRGPTPANNIEVARLWSGKEVQYDEPLRHVADIDAVADQTFILPAVWDGGPKNAYLLDFHYAGGYSENEAAFQAGITEALRCRPAGVQLCTITTETIPVDYGVLMNLFTAGQFEY